MRPQPYGTPPAFPTFQRANLRGYWRANRLAAEAALGADHPAARAALGRELEAVGAVPQRGSITPEAIAWHRQSGAQMGLRNRRWRRYLRQKEARAC